MPIEIPEILRALERSSDEIPHATLREAVARREEITPHLLGILEEVLADPRRAIDDDDYMAHVYAMYLLANFRETRAYPLLVRLFSIPGEVVFSIAGYVVTEDLGSILASVCGNDIGGIAGLIEDERANKYARAAAMDALVTLVACGQRSREEVMAYFAGLFGRLARKPNHVWGTLAAACTDLWPGEVRDEIARAYEDGLVDSSMMEWREVDEALALGKGRALASLARSHYRLIVDVARDISWWSCFRRTERSQATSKPRTPAGAALTATTPLEPSRRTEPKVGRNDPCPCGSGKKYKKCCGA